MLIEYLHLIQDKYGQIRKKHLAALSKLLKIPFAESFEVATKNKYLIIVISKIFN